MFENIIKFKKKSEFCIKNSFFGIFDVEFNFHIAFDIQIIS